MSENIKKIVRKIITASNVMIKPYSENLFSEISIPMEHRSKDITYNDGVAWKEKEYNYRLSYPVEEIYYAFTKSTVIAHIGLDAENRIVAVYVDPSYRGKGVSTKMHEEVFKRKTDVLSDEVGAMEPQEKATWEKLMSKMPKKIKKLEDGSFIYKG